MGNNTITTASDMGYAWGVWLLIASIRKAGMNESVLVGTYNWSQRWLDNILMFPGVKTTELPMTDQRSVTCQKPEIMRRVETDFSTWVDCDGIFWGNCSESIVFKENEIFVRSCAPKELVSAYRKERSPDDNPEEVPRKILDIWCKDIAELQDPRRKQGVSAALIGLHRSRFDFLDKWEQQMIKVLPSDVSVVADGNFAYFQTDNSVLNSLMLFSADAPAIAPNYTVDDKNKPHYIHFSYNPKPWIMWNPATIRFYDQVLDVVDWAYDNGYEPSYPLPLSLQRKYEKIYRRMLRLSPYVTKWQKLKRLLKRKSI